nr:uncharacterized mitochondrial protein AtMg00810-like [Tanacetum cinerariifolium]
MMVEVMGSSRSSGEEAGNVGDSFAGCGGKWNQSARCCWGMMVEVMGSSRSSGEEAGNVGDSFAGCGGKWFYGMKGIKREFSIPRTPQQNGIAERKNRTLIEVARTILADSLLPILFWAEAVNTACYVKNRVNLMERLMRDFWLDTLGGKCLTICAFSLWSSGSKNPQNTDDDATFGVKEPEFEVKKHNNNTFSSAGLSNTAVSLTLGESSYVYTYQYPNDPNMLALEDITYSDNEEDVGVEADFTNLETNITVSPIRTARVHRDHPISQIIGDLSSTPLIRSMTKMVTDQEEVYVCQPPGFKDPDYPDKVYKLIKALYGLHQAPRAWYETLVNYLLENGFQKGKIDQTLFIKRKKAFEKLMKDKFQMSSMGELTFFLGLQVKQKPDGIFISHDKYVAEILRKFDLTDRKSASTPIDTEKPLLKDPDGEDVDVHTYRSMIGSLMYLTSSRPDTMFVVCACAHFQVTPNASQLHAVKRIFRYLNGKPYVGLWYLKDSPFNLVAYSNSDYAGASLDRKSTTGGCQFLGCRLISSQCKKQTVVTTSSTEQADDVADEVAAGVDVGTTQRVESSTDTVMDDQEDASKQGGIIADLDADKDVTLEEVDVAKDAEKKKQSSDRDPEETATPSTIIYSEPKSKDKRKGIMVQEPKPLKKHAQIEQDTAYARELEAERNKNINWDDTEAQARKNMMIFLKNMAGFKMDYFKGMSYDDIRLIFKKYFNSNVAFLEKNKEQLEEEESKALKRTSESLEEKAAKKQKFDKEATPLALKVPVVDYKIYTENNKPYYKIKRFDGSHQLFLSFLSLLRNFDREDLEVLWQLVKERFASSKPKNFSDDFLLTTLTYICSDDLASREKISIDKVYFRADAEQCKTYCCWCKLMLLDNAADIKLKLLEQSAAADFHNDDFDPFVSLCCSFVSSNQESQQRMSKVPYANEVGSLMFLMVCMRPDIAYVVSVVSRYLMNLDYAKDPNKGMSITGYTFLVPGCVVSWKATLQHVVALSTTEVEYMVLTKAVKEAIWLKGLLEKLGVELNTVIVSCDNQGAIHLSWNHVFHKRTKHINVRYHFIREVLEAKTVKVMKVGTEHNVTDALTKVVPGLKLQHCLELLNVGVG